MTSDISPFSTMDSRSRVVLLTGGKRIGAVVARELARRGADVALTYCQSRDEALRTVDAITALGRRALALHADLRRPDACREVVRATVEAFGRLDVFVGMASIYASTPFELLDEEAWNTSLAVDLSSSFHCAHAAARHMQSRDGGGRLLLVTNSEAASGRPRHRGHVPHFVAKSALIALGKALALELARDGILVNILALGPILPDDAASEAENAEAASATALGRWGSADEVARATAAILDLNYQTGEVLRLDGGLHLK